MVYRSVRPQTMDRYRKKLAYWDAYLEGVRNNPNAVYPGRVMDHLVYDRRSMSHYLSYLVGTMRLISTAVSAVVNDLHKIMVAAGQHTAFFEGDIVITTRRSLQLSERADRYSYQGGGDTITAIDASNGGAYSPAVLDRGDG